MNPLLWWLVPPDTPVAGISALAVAATTGALVLADLFARLCC